MSNVFEFKTAAEMMQMLQELNQKVSGMSVAEAAAALGFTKTASGIYVKTLIQTGAKSVAGSTALEVVSGTTASSTASNLVLYETAAGTAEVGGLASVILPVAASMLAAVGGYLIGNQIYEQNSEFLDKLMFPLYDYITGNNVTETLYPNVPATYSDDYVPTVPMIFNASGHTFMDSRAYNAVKNFLTNVGSKPPTPAYSPYLQPKPAWWNFSKAVPGTPAFAYSIVGGICVEEAYAPPGSAVCMYQSQLPSYPHIVKGLSVKNGVVGSFFNYVDVWSPVKGWPPSIRSTTYTDEFGLSLDASNAVITDFIIFKTLAAASQWLLTGKVNSINDIYYLPAPLYLKTDGTLGLGMPSEITKYTPGVNGVVPMKFPLEVPEWTPVTLPVQPTSPDILPDPTPVPEVIPADYPERITPQIKPKKKQPATVPKKVPATKPTIPIIPVPDPNDDTSTKPTTDPDPTSDPSQEPASQPLPQQVPVTVEPIVDTGGTTPPVLPVVPSPTSAATGLLHVYNPTATQVDAFGSWLWTTFSGDLIDTLGKLFNNPMDAVIGLHEIYCTPAKSSSDVNIRAGFLASDVASRLVTERYKEIKCGALSVPEYWSNYLDYAPYTKTYCYLPFIGIVELNADDIVGSGVEITYRIDVYNGSCIALITTAKPNSDESVSYQFEGNCSVSVPITSGMLTSLQSALIGVATTALGVGATAAVTVATGGMALPAAVMAGSVGAGAAKQGITTKNQVQYSGSFGSSYGAMGIKKPFLIVKRPRQKVVPGYNQNYGYPAHKMVAVSSCTGYLRAIEVDVISATATEAEKKMIEQLLKSGVFVD